MLKYLHSIVNPSNVKFTGEFCESLISIKFEISHIKEYFVTFVFLKFPGIGENIDGSTG